MSKQQEQGSLYLVVTQQLEDALGVADLLVHIQGRAKVVADAEVAGVGSQRLEGVLNIRNSRSTQGISLCKPRFTSGNSRSSDRYVP